MATCMASQSVRHDERRNLRGPQANGGVNRPVGTGLSPPKRAAGKCGHRHAVKARAVRERFRVSSNWRSRVPLTRAVLSLTHRVDL